MDYITVGKILKAQGLKGEIKVQPFTDDVARFYKLKLVYIDDVPYKIVGCRAEAFVYLSLMQVGSREAAEKLVGKEVRIDRVNAVAPEEDAFYICDLLGASVELDDGTVIGVLDDVLQYGAADVFECKTTAGKFVRFPFLKKLNLKFDSESKTVTLNAKAFTEVAVYDD